MTVNDGVCWLRAHTFVIDYGVTSIGNDFGRVIRIGKTKYMQTDSDVVLVMSYTWAKKSTFCGLWYILVVPYVIEDGPETAKG